MSNVKELKEMLEDAADVLRDEGYEALADAVALANARVHGGDEGPPSQRLIAHEDHALFLGH